MFAISTDEEHYHGSFKTVEEAVAEAAVGYAYGTFWVGKCTPPPQPETFWCAEDWLEQVSCQDSYCNDFAEGWDDSTAAQHEELELEVQKVMSAWLDRHQLRPRFFLIDDPVKYVVVDGVPQKASEYFV